MKFLRQAHSQTEDVCGRMEEDAPAGEKTKTKKGHRILLTSQDQREVRFLGLAGYYCRFVSGFAELTSTLTDFTLKGAPDLLDKAVPGSVCASV